MGFFMNIRTSLFAAIIVFCCNASAMNQEQMMMLIQHGSEGDIREFVESQSPVDTSFFMNGFRHGVAEAVAALIIADKRDTVFGKCVAGALGCLVVAEVITFMAGVITAVKQKDQQNKLFQYFMNIRKGIEMRKKAESFEDHEAENSIDE